MPLSRDSILEAPLRRGALVGLVIGLVLVAGVHAATMAASGARGGPLTAATGDSACPTEVVHDAFRFDNATVEQAVNGSASSVVKNTKVRVQPTDFFVRVHAENPNGYCVAFTVQIDRQIVAPAELGGVESIDGNHSTEWHAVRDFARNETYTAVTFTLPPGTQATFAPNRARIKNLAWVGEAKATGESVAHSIGEWLNVPALGTPEPTLQKRTYTFSPQTNTTEIITVSLTNASTGGRVTEWQALYRVPAKQGTGDGGWRPITQDASQPVYYAKPTKDTVQFHFNNPRAEVRFTANPTTWDEIAHEYREYTAGIDWFQTLLSTAPTLTIPSPTVPSTPHP